MKYESYRKIINSEDMILRGKISGLKAYYFLKQVGGSFASAYTNKNGISQYMYDCICPYFISLVLSEVKRAGRVKSL